MSRFSSRGMLGGGAWPRLDRSKMFSILVAIGSMSNCDPGDYSAKKIREMVRGGTMTYDEEMNERIANFLVEVLK